MGRIIAVANQKGGVGKTTTAINLAAYLAIEGKSVLLVDFDDQGNATSGLGFERSTLEACVYDALMEQVELEEVLLPTMLETLTLLPATRNLAGAAVELVEIEQREQALARLLEQIQADYEYIIIDSPPSLGLLTINALTAADSILIPVQCEYYALEGLSDLMQTIEQIKEFLNPKLAIEGIVLTMYDSRTNLALDVVEEIQRNFSGKVFTAIIPRNVRVAEAPSHGLPIALYASLSKGAESYSALAKEVINNGN
ncbi:MAG: AAA family ATPase [Clostridia bacterium]